MKRKTVDGERCLLYILHTGASVNVIAYYIFYVESYVYVICFTLLQIIILIIFHMSISIIFHIMQTSHILYVLKLPQ